MLDYEPDKLEKVITNLLTNAFKFTPNCGSIIVTVTTKEKTARKGAKNTQKKSFARP